MDSFHAHPSCDLYVIKTEKKMLLHVSIGFKVYFYMDKHWKCPWYNATYAHICNFFGIKQNYKGEIIITMTRGGSFLEILIWKEKGAEVLCINKVKKSILGGGEILLYIILISVK